MANQQTFFYKLAIKYKQHVFNNSLLRHLTVNQIRVSRLANL